MAGDVTATNAVKRFYRAVSWGRSEIPNPKIQIPNKFQIPNSQSLNCTAQSPSTLKLIAGDVTATNAVKRFYRAVSWGRSEIPNPKIQIPNKFQIPNSQSLNCTAQSATRLQLMAGELMVDGGER